MDIVHVCRQFSPGIGGMEGVVAQLARQQIAAMHNVRVVTLNRIFDDPDRKVLAAREVIDGIRIDRVPFRGTRRYPLAPGILGLMRGADIIHVHGVDFMADYLAATRVFHRTPMVISTHGGFFHTDYAARLKKLYFHTATRLSMRAFDRVIASSLQDEDAFRPICQSRLMAIENGVDVAKFAGLADQQAQTMIYFGRLAPNKRIDRLIAWFAKLLELDPDWRLIIAGKPMGVLAAGLKAMALKAGVADAVEIHDTPSDAALAALISRSSVYLCASSYEGFGLAAVEAASAGLVPVLSKIPAFERTVQRLGFGLLSDFGLGQDQVVADLKQIEAARSRLTHDIAAIAVRPFAWESVSRRFEAVDHAILGTHERQIGGVSVAVMAQDRALATLGDAIVRHRGGKFSFCNAHSVNVARNHSAFREAMNAATVFNDGAGISIASRILFHKPFPANLNGTDLVPALFAGFAKPRTVFLLGSAPGVAEVAARVFEARYPFVRVIGCAHGFVSAGDEAGLVDHIASLAPDLILVGMGQPRQELWAQTHAAKFDGVTLCVGALLDFTAGIVPRAPSLVRRVHLEWVYRLVQEPRRLASRYLIGNVRFLFCVLGQRLRWSTLSTEKGSLI